MNINKKKYNQSGFAIIKNLVSQNQVKSVLKIIAHNLSYYSSSKISKLHKGLLDLRLTNPKKFGLLFDTVQTLIINYQILSQNKILNLCKKILGEKGSSIILTDVSLRLDPPMDRRNALEWHQDSSYFRQNDKCFDSLVLWIPLIDLNNDTGGLDVLSESYKIGQLKIKKKLNSSKLYQSNQRKIEESKIKNFEEVNCNFLKKGDGIIMNMDQIHRSGTNRSDKFRISLIGRYHKTSVNTFNSGLNVYKYSCKNLNKEVHGF